MAAGEDPIGTAIAADQWLFIEMPLPWPQAPLAEHPLGHTLQPLLADIERQPTRDRLRLGAIASDADTAAPKNSPPGYSHLLFYHRPGPLFAEFVAQAYCLPAERIADLARALLLEPQRLHSFSAYRLPYPTRDLLVCTHTRYDVACGRFGYPLYRTLRQRYTGDAQRRDHPADSPHPASPVVRVWQTSHFGGHQFAPTLIDFPGGRFWGHLQPEVLETLVMQSGDVSQLRQFYRGWAGGDRWIQVLEREIWMRVGWPWLTYEKAGKVIAQDPGRPIYRLVGWILQWLPGPKTQALLKRLHDKHAWAEVEITARQPGATQTQRYRGRVEVSHQVITQAQSGVAQSQYEANQYRVVNLEPISP